MIYLDYAATTPTDPAVIDAVSDAMSDPLLMANPSAVHMAGRSSAAATDEAIGEVAALIRCDPRELILTSGATEANNLALIGAARYRADRGRHLVTSRTEHKAVVEVFERLEAEGFDVTWLDPDSDGLISTDDVLAALRDDTQLVSIMHINNETGVVQDIAALGAALKERDVLFHVDAAQSAGKLEIDVKRLSIDLLSVSAHKFYGPKGIGALFVANRPGCHIEPLMVGGGQQRGQRPGTLPVPLIVGFGTAAKLARERMLKDHAHAERLHDRLLDGIANLPGVVLNGHPDGAHYPGIVNFSADGVEGESLLLALEPLCVATGSACNSKNAEPSYVLRALGLSDALAQSAIRVSFGRFTTDVEIDTAVTSYRAAIERLRRLAPAA